MIDRFEGGGVLTFFYSTLKMYINMYESGITVESIRVLFPQ